MDAAMFIVRANVIFHGPFLKDSAEHFAANAGSDSEIHPLRLPQGANDQQQAPTIRVVSNEDYRSAHDEVTVETLVIIAGVTQSVFFALRAGRVLTREELLVFSDALADAHSAIESLMHYAEVTASSPTPENLVALRKAFWRNRGSKDFDPHYADRAW